MHFSGILKKAHQVNSTIDKKPTKSKAHFYVKRWYRFKHFLGLQSKKPFHFL